MRTVLQNWAKYPEPMCRVLDDNLQNVWIDPLVERLRSLGCTIHLGHRLERLHIEAGSVKQLVFRRGTSPETTKVNVDVVLLAIPAEYNFNRIEHPVHAYSCFAGRDHRQEKGIALLTGVLLW